MRSSHAGVVGACAALGAFAVAVFVGIVNEVETSSILLRAILAMLVCYGVGVGVGIALDHVIRDQLARVSRGEVSIGSPAVATIPATVAVPAPQGAEEEILDV